MHAESDMVFLDGAAPRESAAQPGIRATIRALVGRLGAPDLAATEALGLLPPPLSMPLAAASADWETGPRDPAAEPEETAPTRTHRAAAALRRANAHAAYASVEGTHEAALDAALAVVEAELAAIEIRCAAQAEALKRLRLYANDAATRALATKGLVGDAEILADHRVVDRDPARAGACHA